MSTTNPATYESLFNPSFNYTAAEIAAATGLDVELVRAAGQRGEISCVCTLSRDGVNKCWKGDKVVAWLNRRAAANPLPQARNV